MNARHFANLSLLAVALSSCFVSVLAHGENYSNAVFFGDSLTDSGYFESSTFPFYSTGKFTTVPDLVWSEHLGNHLGYKITPDTLEGKKGNNHAIGGARAGEVVINNTLGHPITLTPATTQVANYLSQGVDVNALHSVWIGANDLFAATEAAKTNPAAVPTIIANAATSAAQAIGSLSAAGAKYILVPNVPDVGKLPDVVGNPQQSAAASNAAATYNKLLYAQAKASGANVIPLDTFTLVQEIAAAPQTYGFSNMTAKACKNSSSLICSSLVEKNANNSYFFADSVHPTGRVHRMLGDYAYSVITTPTEVAKLPHFATTQGLQAQEAVTQGLEKSPHGFWIHGQNTIGKNTNFANQNTVLAVGIGYQPAITHGKVGVFFTQAAAGLGQNNLNASINDFGAGIYHTAFWDRLGLKTQAQIGFAHLVAKTQRALNLDNHRSSYLARTTGQRYFAKADISKPIALKHATLMPYASLAATQVRLNPLAEESASATAMTFNEQKRETAYGTLGLAGQLPLTSSLKLLGDVHYQYLLAQRADLPAARLNSLQDISFNTPRPTFDHSNFGLKMGLSANFSQAQAGAFVGLDQGQNAESVSAGVSVGTVF